MFLLCLYGREDLAEKMIEQQGIDERRYVLQQLKNKTNKQINYWTSRSNIAEIDFVLQVENLIVPIEVKATTNLKAKSLAQYRKEYMPPKAVRTSLANYKADGDLYNIPLYMIGILETLLE